MRWCDVECREIHNARRENFNWETPQATVRLSCDYDNRYAAIHDLINERRPYPFNTSTAFAKPKLYCHEATIVTEPTRFQSDTDEEVIDYLHKSYIDVTYKPLAGIALYNSTIILYEEDEQGNPLETQIGYLHVEESFEPNVEFLTFDHRHYFWKTSGERVLQGSESGYPLRRLVLNRKVCGYLKLPVGMTDWETKTNDTEYISDILPYQFEIGTLQFTDPKISYGFYNYSYDIPTFCIEASLIWQPDGWNKFPKLDCSGTEAAISFDEIQVQCEYGDNATKKDYEPFVEEDLSKFLFSSHSHPGSLWDPDEFSNPTP